MFRYGELGFGGDIVWMHNMGNAGRGVIMGGSAHFSDKLAPLFVEDAMQAQPNYQAVAVPIQVPVSFEPYFQLFGTK